MPTRTIQRPISTTQAQATNTTQQKQDQAAIQAKGDQASTRPASPSIKPNPEQHT
jgi:hypothetical protein